MARYRYLLASISDGDVLAELPFQSASYSHALNGPGSFSGTMGLRQPTKLASVLSTALNLGRVAIYVERDGQIVWSGPVWTDVTDEDTESYTLNAEGWLSYFRRRILRETKTYSADDQVDIATNLLDYAISLNGVDIVTSDTTLTGVLRDRTYEGFERKNIGEAVEQLAALEDGFDFRFESRWNSGALETRFLTSYPPTGRTTKLVFESGKQLSKLRVTGDTTTLATNVDAIGAGEGDAGLIATVADPALLDDYPQLDEVISHTDVSEFATLDGHARKRLRRGTAPTVIPNIEFDPSLEPVLGSFLVGDIVRVRGGIGFKTINLQARITEYAISVDDSGGESGTMSFAGLDIF